MGDFDRSLAGLGDQGVEFLEFFGDDWFFERLVEDVHCLITTGHEHLPSVWSRPGAVRRRGGWM